MTSAGCEALITFHEYLLCNLYNWICCTVNAMLTDMLIKYNYAHFLLTICESVDLHVCLVVIFSVNREYNRACIHDILVIYAWNNR